MVGVVVGFDGEVVTLIVKRVDEVGDVAVAINGN